MLHRCRPQVRNFITGTCVAVVLGAAAATHAQVAPLKVTRVANGLSSPIYVTAPPGDTNRLFIVQQGGQIRIMNLQTLAIDATPFLSITGLAAGSEQGLLGLAFDPDYAMNGKFYVNVTVATTGTTQIRQYQVSAGNPDIADPASVKTVLTFSQPQSNHNGGWIGFSPRAGDTRNLYIATGDGGNANDQGTGHIEPGGNAQNNTTLLGKMLRITIDAATGTYTIPANNPYGGAATPVRPEIFNIGLRNPYRCSFDRLTGDLFIGDVGQTAREEISVQKASNAGGGENYEWRLREGFIQTPGGSPAVGGASPPGGVPPIFDYPRSTSTSPFIAGRTVIGGYIYRGHQIPSLRGVYVFGDYLGPTGGTARVFMFNYDGNIVSNPQDITNALFAGSGFTFSLLSSLGEDQNGELYLVSAGGAIYRIDPVTPHIETGEVTKVPGGRASVYGRGVPFKMHNVQTTDTLVEQFTTVGTATANGSGALVYEDSSAGKTPQGQRFYRFTYP